MWEMRLVLVYSPPTGQMATEAETAFVYVDNNETNLVNYGSAPTFVNLSGQKGTLADAMAHQVIVGSTPVSGLSGGKGSVSLAYKTGIAKIVVSYPEGTRVKQGETTITLGGDAQYNKIELMLDSPEKSSTKGAITVPAIVDTVKCTSTAYVAIWPVGGEYTNTNLLNDAVLPSAASPLRIWVLPTEVPSAFAKRIRRKSLAVKAVFMPSPCADGRVASIVKAFTVAFSSLNSFTSSPLSQAENIAIAERAQANVNNIFFI